MRPWRPCTALLAGSLLAVATAYAGEPYNLSVEAPPARVGAPSTARVRILPAAGYHMNEQFPTSLRLTAPPGVDLPRAAFSAGDGSARVQAGEIRIEVAFTPRAPGPKTFEGTASFAVCTATACNPRKVPVTFTVQVK